MKIKITFLLFAVVYVSTIITAQVPVREEPRHHPVLENKYIRLLDVWLPPGDTTMFHVHEIPSLFVILSNTLTSSQVKGKDWDTASLGTAGATWYRSFAEGPLIHRVCNTDRIPFHVNDIEILSAYDTNTSRKLLPFKVLFENNRATAYHLTDSSFGKKMISGRGPLVAELVAGNEIVFHTVKENKSINLQAGKYLYIEPGSSFYFSTKGNKEINMVLFEIK